MARRGLGVGPVGQIKVGARLGVEGEDVVRIHLQRLAGRLERLLVFVEVAENPRAQGKEIGAAGIKPDGAVDGLQRLLVVLAPVTITERQLVIVIALRILRLHPNRRLQKLLRLRRPSHHAQHPPALQVGLVGVEGLVGHERAYFLMPRNERTSL